MYKLTYFVNCSGWVVNAIYNKRGYANVSYFATKKEAMEWIKEFENVDFVSLDFVTDSEFATDIILI
jgi:uncharacterized radical SAM superfamily protein